MANTTNKFVLTNTGEEDQVFDSLEDTQTYIEDEIEAGNLDEESTDTIRVYKVATAYEVTHAGVELEEVDL